MSDEPEAEPADDRTEDAPPEESREATDADAEAGEESAEEAEAGSEAAGDSDAGDGEGDAGDATAAAEVDDDGDDGDEDGIGNDDVISLAYTMRTAEDGTVIDTTDPEVAEEEGLETEGVDVGPRTIVVGRGQVFQAVDDAIRGGQVGDSGEVTVPCEQAFGEYDPDEVETISTDRIPEDQRYPGAQVELDGRQGVVETVYPGRSRVDFNHPLAGADLEYDYEVLDVVEDPEEKARGMLHTYFDVELDVDIRTDEVEESVAPEAHRQEDDEAADEEAPDEPDDDEDAEPTTETEVVEKETLYVESSPQLQFNQQWLFSKQQIAQQLIDVTGVDRVVIQEIIESQPAGMPGMMGGGLGDIEAALEDEEVSAEDVVEELGGEEAAESDEADEGEEAAGQDETTE